MLSLGGVAHYLYRHKLDIGCVVVLVVIAAEVHLRTPWGRQMEYQGDPELVGVLRPGQSSLRESVNADGHRGRETDWSRPAVVAVGDSQGWGTGLADDAIWTARLQALLRGRLDLPDVQVVNASHPGHGPYHQYIRLRRVLEKHAVEAALVRVSIEDRNFTAPPAEELPRLAAAVDSRQTWRALTKSVPFVAKKLLGEGSWLASLWPFGKKPASTARGEEVGEKMWTRQGQWWQRMVELADQTGTPLIFVIHDPTDLPSNGVLQRRLLALADQHARVHVIRLGSREWGLGASEPGQLWKEYRLRYTLQHDPHGNARHHEVVARSVFAYLKRNEVLTGGQRLSRR